MTNHRWGKFERVASAIREVETEGAAVKWNTRINGRRFDAALRFKYRFQEFLMVVRCVDYSSPITPAIVKNFAKEVERAGANIGVMVTSSEYDEDAFKLSAEYSVALLDWQTMQEMSDESLADTFRPSPLVYNFRFVLPDHSEVGIPEEPPVLKFLMREIRIKGPGIDTCPEQLVDEVYEDVMRAAVGKPQIYELPLPEGTVMIHPSSQGEHFVKALAFNYRLIPRSELLNPDAHIEDHYGVTEESQKEELAKRNRSADPSRIGVGFETILRPSKYYYNPQLRFSYYCEEVKKGRAKIVLVESYLNRGLLQARFVVMRSAYNQFVEVTEQSEIDRLTKIYDTFSLPNKNLEGRFNVFLRDWDQAESIDDLELSPEQREAKKGDYLFESRTIIGELKALYDDTSPKMEAILEPHRERPEWPLFYSEQQVHTVLKHLPDGDKIQSEIFEAITTSIDGVIEKANRQIRSTKATFGLPDAGGLLIILNDTVDILDPHLVAHRIRKSLNKRTDKGEIRFPHVSVVVVIAAAHYAQMNPELQGVPILILPNTVPEADRVEEFVRILNKKWSAFDRKPLLSIETEQFPTLTFKNVREGDSKKSTRPRTRQEHWSAMYRQSPYLRSLDEEQLLAVGQEVFENLTMRFIKGAPSTPKEEMEQIMIRWSNFLDEVAHRGMDMKKFVTKISDLGEKVEELYQQYQARLNSNRDAETDEYQKGKGHLEEE